METRTFSISDQQLFADLSGDRNPLHVDAVAARRLLFGGAAVHGVHLALWALESWMGKKRRPVRLKTLSADFRSPVLVGRNAALRPGEDAGNGLSCAVDTENQTAARIAWEYEKKALPRGPALPAAPPAPCACEDRSGLSLSGLRGSLALFLSLPLFRELFPCLAEFLPPDQAAGLLAMTRLVGMECPGLHSIFHGLSLQFPDGPPGPPVLDYEVAAFDPRISRVQIKVESSAACGLLTAFVRPAPCAQPGFGDAAGAVAPGEFSDQLAVVIGGSRGLGELCVKLLAAGGAQVAFSYRSGKDEAVRIAEEAAAAGARVAPFAWDVCEPGDPPRLFDGAPATHLYYFATPFIFEGVKKKFSRSLFARFCDYYVTGFVDTVERWAPPKGQRLVVLYPSSVAVDEVPLAMGEYASAKAAGEWACRFLAKAHREVVCEIARLPRLATDQTASIMEVGNREPLPELLGVLRAVHGKSRTDGE